MIGTLDKEEEALVELMVKDIVRIPLQQRKQILISFLYNYKRICFIADVINVVPDPFGLSK